MNRLFYIGFYATPQTSPKRKIPLSARNKMDYTISVLSSIFDKVTVVSPARIEDNESGAKSTQEQLSDNCDLILFGNIKSSSRFKAIINVLLCRTKLFLYLLRHVKHNDFVQVYHSLAISKIIRLAQKIIGFKLVLEFNEMYSDVMPEFEKQREEEYKIIESADAYIFPNNLLDGLVNSHSKPSIVQYGIYKVERHLAEHIDDGKIHIVYAGTLDPSKGGLVAAAVAKFLTPDYHVHILGFGTPEQQNLLRQTIAALNDGEHAQVTYDGLLDGDNFLAFLQKCHIGLSPQDPNAKYNATSFPSKLMTYFSNGLQVVSIDIPAIAKSELAQNISFYHEQDPSKIAEAIQNISQFEPHFSFITQLHKKYVNDLTDLYQQLSSK